VGLKTINDFSIEVYNDINRDSISESNELINQISGSSLSPGDSLDYNFSTTNFNPGENLFIAKLNTSEDQDTTDNLVYTEFKAVKINEGRNDLVINEFMYAPNSPEPEWIEIFNRSDKNINIKNYKIADDRDTVSILRQSLILNSKEYCVIASDSSLLNFYKITSPFIAANFPTLNNDGDKIILIDSLNRTIDSLKYYPDWGGSNGNSLERINPDLPAADESNWATCRSSNHGTPGYINSVSQKDYDVKLDSIIFNPLNPVYGSDVNISLKVTNAGKNPADFSVELYSDTNLDSLPDNLIKQNGQLHLNPGDSLINNIYGIKNFSKETGYLAKIIFGKDQDTTNNSLYKILRPGYNNSSVIINEVMFSPAVGEPEWIELFNNSNENVNLKDWTISDVLPAISNKIITNKNLYLNSGEYIVIASDSSFFNFHPDFKAKSTVVNFGALGNSEDGIVLKDFYGNTIDSLFYDKNWESEDGFSIERVSVSRATNDSTNWKPSININKSTPGYLNSVSDAKSYLSNSLVINEIMYDPSSNGSQFVEFYNTSGDTINIGGWEMQNENGNYNYLSPISFNVPPKIYFVLFADSSGIQEYSLQNYNYKNMLNTSSLNLTSSGNLILLKDLNGNTIDSVFYSPNWQNKNILDTKGISLEKINPLADGNDPLNWSSSADPSGATPGRQNSIFSINTNKTASISVSPDPFSPDNDGYQDFTIINYRLKSKTAQIRVRIFDSRGRLVQTLANNKPSGANGSIVFNGKDDNGHVLRMGIYIVLLEALSENGTSLQTLKTVVVVARKL
jgi:Lamin Tail Domain/CHU_C Type IX secretion signal domain